MIKIIIFIIFCAITAKSQSVDYIYTYCFKNGITNPAPDAFSLVFDSSLGTVDIPHWDMSIEKPTIEQLLSVSNDVVSTMAILKEIKNKEIQKAKILSLKQTENAFLTICDQLSGTNTHAKLGFAELDTKINTLYDTDPTLATKLSIKLLSIDASGKRDGGLLWWDTCAWHDDI